MAEVIIPPEELEPELPEEQLPQVEKPTEKSKVISVDFNPLNTKQTASLDTRESFYTTDTDAWIVLNVGDMNEPTGQYSLALINKEDGSIFQRTGDIVQGVAYYKLLPNEIKHAGRWVGQAVITFVNGQTTASRFSFNVSGHILDGKDVREIVIQDFQTLMAQLNDLKDNATNEFSFLKNEFEAFQAIAQENEDERQATELERVAAEIIREESYESKVTAAIVEADLVEKVDNKVAELAPTIQQVTAQLAQKVTKGDIGISDLNKNKIQFDETWISDSLKAQILGTTPLGATPPDDSLSTVKFIAKSVTPDKTSFLEIGGFSKVTTDLYKSITLSPQGDFYIIENGKMANTSATQPYKNTGKVVISNEATYKTRGVNTWLFYGANDTYLGYWAYNAGGAIDASTIQDLPIKDGSMYMIGNINNSYWKTTPVAIPQILESKETTDSISFPQLVVEPSNFSDETKDFINRTGSGISNKYKGKIVVNLGDSIIETKNPSISEFIATDLEATVINGGFGGCMMSPHPNAEYAKFSMTAIAEAIATGVWTSQAGATGVPSSFAATVAILKSINWSDVDIITISYGTNDWLNSNLLDNSSNLYDTASYLGALRHSIRKIRQTYPKIKILVTAPIYRSTNNRLENAYTWRNSNQVRIIEFVDGLDRIRREIAVPIADTFFGLGINQWNEGYYFPANDGTHPNAFGRELLGQKIANSIRSVY